MKSMIAFPMIAALMLTGAALAKGGHPGTVTVVTCESRLPLRSSPGPSAATVTRIPLGASVEANRHNGHGSRMNA